MLGFDNKADLTMTVDNASVNECCCKEAIKFFNPPAQIYIISTVLKWTLKTVCPNVKLADELLSYDQKRAM